MGTLYQIFVFIVVFLAVVFFHELGHFTLAKMNGIGVKEFMLGFGPKIAKFKKGETLYSLRAIPLGGAVVMKGEGEESDEPDSFAAKARWRRLSVMFAGPFMNLLFALVLFVIIFISVGYPTTSIGSVLDDSPAYHSNLMKGDTILSVNDQPINSWNDFVSAVKNSKASPLDLSLVVSGQPINNWNDIVSVVKSSTNRPLSLALVVDNKPVKSMDDIVAITENLKVSPLSLKIKRGDKILPDVVIIPRISQSVPGSYEIGVTCQNEPSIVNRAIYGAEMCADLTVKVVKVIPKLFTDKEFVKKVSGPIGIASEVGKAARHGFFNIAIFTAFISINLGIMNLLPIVPFDGGKIFILLIESIIRKPLNQKVENAISFTGLFLVMGLFVFVMFNDIVKLV